MEIFVCGVGFWMFLAQKIQRFVSMESLRSLRSVALLMNIWYMNLIERNLHCYNQEPQHTCESRVRSWRGQIIQNVPVCPLPIPFNPLHASISACSNSVQQKLSYAAVRKGVECDGRNCILFTRSMADSENLENHRVHWQHQQPNFTI